MLDFPAIRQRAIQTWTHYNIPMLFACLGTLLVVWQIVTDVHQNITTEIITMAAGLSFTASVSLELFIRHGRLPSRFKVAVNIIVFVFALGISSYWRSERDDFAAGHYLFLEIALFLLLVSMPYFIYRKNDRAFWYYNDSLCSGLIFAMIAMLTVAAGLGAIVLSINYLFKTDITFRCYAAIMAAVGGIGMPLLWLQAIPLDAIGDAQKVGGEKMKQNVIVWIFMPLVLLYGIILHVYFAKIIVPQELPRGLLSILILCFAGAALLGYLTSWIFRSDVIWLARFQRCLPYILALPLVFLCVAIGQRIHDYGLTTKRILLCLFAVWLAQAIWLIWKSQRQDGALVKLSLSLAVAFLLAVFVPDVKGIDRAPLYEDQQKSSGAQPTILSYVQFRTPLSKAADMLEATIPVYGYDCLKEGRLGPYNKTINLTCQGHNYIVEWDNAQHLIVVHDKNIQTAADDIIATLHFDHATKDYYAQSKIQHQGEVVLPQDVFFDFENNGAINARWLVKDIGIQLDGANNISELSTYGYLLLKIPH